MAHKTLVLDNFKVANSLTFELISEEGLTKVNSKAPKVFKKLTIVVDEDSGFIVPSILEYIVTRAQQGRIDSSPEARALRLYFDFLEQCDLKWDKGSNISYERPISIFSKFLEEQYRESLIAPTTAVNYFNSVCRFYKHHLKFNYPFDGVPIVFTKHVIHKYDNSLTSHIKGHQIEVDVADCKPNISANETQRPLKPLSKIDYPIFFKVLIEESSIELFLICLTAVVTGLRAEEVADLRGDMINKYIGHGEYNLIVGPQIKHKTKGNKNGQILADGKIFTELLKYNKSNRYLKRLEKYKGIRANVFLTKNGKPYTQNLISTLFNNFLHEKLLPIIPNFVHKFHDLRTTFGVHEMTACLAAGFTDTQALAHVKIQMRHEDLTSTLRYLRYWERSVVVKKKSERNEKLLQEIYSELDARGYDA